MPCNPDSEHNDHSMPYSRLTCPELSSGDFLFYEFCNYEDSDLREITPQDGLSVGLDRSNPPQSFQSSTEHQSPNVLQEFNTSVVSRYPAAPIPIQEISMSPRRSEEYVCDVCNTVFDQRPLFNRHARRHKKPYVCDVQGCRSAFTYPKDLRRHTTSVHSAKRQYEGIVDDPKFYCKDPGCDYAYRGIPRRDNYIRHVRRKHPEIKVAGSRESSSSLEPSSPEAAAL